MLLAAIIPRSSVQDCNKSDNNTLNMDKLSIKETSKQENCIDNKKNYTKIMVWTIFINKWETVVVL